MTDTGHKNRMSGVTIGEPLPEARVTIPAVHPEAANQPNECGV